MRRNKPSAVLLCLVRVSCACFLVALSSEAGPVECSQPAGGQDGGGPPSSWGCSGWQVHTPSQQSVVENGSLHMVLYR